MHPRAAHLTAQGGMGGAQGGAAGVMHAGRKWHATAGSAGRARKWGRRSARAVRPRAGLQGASGAASRRCRACEWQCPWAGPRLQRRRRTCSCGCAGMGGSGMGSPSPCCASSPSFPSSFAASPSLLFCGSRGERAGVARTASQSSGVAGAPSLAGPAPAHLRLCLVRLLLVGLGGAVLRRLLHENRLLPLPHRRPFRFAGQAAAAGRHPGQTLGRALRSARPPHSPKTAPSVPN